MLEKIYDKIDKFCNETDWKKYPTYEHALEEFIKGIVAEETKELQAKLDFFLTEKVDGKEYRPKWELEELEKQNKELQEELKTLKHNKKTVFHLSNCLSDAQEKKIADIEKENAELKNRNQELLQSCEGATMMYKDLQKANEIIKKYLSIGVGGKITQNYLDVTKEAKQFLKVK